MKTLVKGARLLGGPPADLLIDGDRIAEVGSLSAGSDVEVLDADGLVALPPPVEVNGRPDEATSGGDLHAEHPCISFPHRQ